MEKIYCPNCLKTNKLKNQNCFNCKQSLLFNDKYYLVSILGENSGKTYLATKKGLHPSLQEFIIKELSIKKMKKWKEEELFKRERLALSNLNHRFIPKFIDEIDIKRGKIFNYYTVIEYIDGENLKNFMKNKIFEENKVIYFLETLSNILDYIHSFTPPIIHRDIKPSNIIIKDDGFYLIDFGSVTSIVKEEGGSTIAGTFGYMAPEQFLGKANAATDYYALGIIAIEMLTGKSPEEFINNHQVDWENLNITKKMKEIISKLLIYDYKKRLNSKEELLFLLSPPAKERQFDIVNFLTQYNKNIDPHKNSTRLKFYDIIYILVSLGVTSGIAFRDIKESTTFWLIGVLISIVLTTFGFFIIQRHKERKFISQKMNVYDGEENIELQVSALSLFCDRKLYKKNRNIYYSKLDKRLTKYLDLDKSFQYHKFTKDKDFITKHLENTERFRDPYIRALQIRLNDLDNNNFKITDEEIKKLMTNEEKKELMRKEI